ncbi:MAG: alkaline phosphatase family protein [Acidobacteriota bacterium]
MKRTAALGAFAGAASVALAATLAFAAARALPARIPASIDFMERDRELDDWVRRSALPFLAAGILAGIGGALLPPVALAVDARRGRIATLALAACVTADCAWISTARMDRIPHVFDEFNYLFQAKNLAEGRMGAPVPPFVDHFNQIFFVIHGGYWYGSSLPGHPLVLALGVLAGSAWLVDPLLAGIALLLLHRFLERALGPPMALAGATLLAISPFFRILGSVYLAHETTLCCALALLHAFTRLVDTGKLSYALGASLAFALGFLARPQAILVWGIALGAWSIPRLFAGKTPVSRRAGATLLVLILPALPFAAFDLAYDKVLTGEWTNTPRAIVSPSHHIGFGTDIGRRMTDGTYIGHSPKKGVENVRLLIRLLGRDLYGFWGASLVFLPFSLLALRRSAMVAVSWGALALNSAIYFAYFTPSPLYGPRYYYEMLPALILLTLEGAAVLVSLLPSKARARQGLLTGLAALTIASLAVYGPAHLDRYQPDKATALRKVLPSLPPGRAIVLAPPPYFTARVQSWNDPLLGAEVLFGSDLGDRKNRALLASMPDRKAYRFRYDRATDTGRLTPYDADTPRVLVVGIDSATWTVMDPLIAKGELPAFAALRARGAWASLATLRPTLSPAIWTSIATGVRPERHGITGFVGGDDPEKELQITSDQRRAAALWDMCGARDVRSDVIDYWCTWPAEPIAGVMVSDRARLAGLPDRVHPKKLLPLVQGKLGIDEGAQAGDGLKASQHFAVDDDKLLDLCLEILDRDPAPLAIVYFRNLDIVQHKSWMYYEPEGFDVAAAEVEKNRDAIPAAYRHYDAMLGKLVAAMPDGASIVVVSDHGMESAAHEPPALVFQTNKLLERLGLLVYARFPIPDKDRSKAFSSATKLGDAAIVYASNDDAVAAVRAALAAVTIDGMPLAVRTDVKGKRLTIELSPLVATGREIGLPSGPVPLSDFVHERILKVSGQHENAPPGILVITGPDVKAGVEIHDATVLDVAPTILDLLGLPPAEDIDGKALTEALTRPPHAGAPVAYRRAPPSSSAKLPEERKQEILEQLGGLNYIER